MSRTRETATAIAAAVAEGATAEVVGSQELAGANVRYMEVDGVPVALPEQPRHEAPGIRVTYPNGYVALYVTGDEERARELLAMARSSDAGPVSEGE